jgi:hypothetical protein
MSHLFQHNCFFSKVLNVEDVFVFPIGLIYFQFNIRKTNIVAFASLSSQNLWLITIANAVFVSNAPINPDVLTKVFQLDRNVFNYLLKKYSGTINREIYLIANNESLDGSDRSSLSSFNSINVTS